MADPSHDQWHVLCTRPNRESLVCGWLSDHGIPAYFPIVRSCSSMTKNRLEPLFPGYLFARLDSAGQDAHLLDGAPGLRSVVTIGRRPAAVDDALIEQIQESVEGINRMGWAPNRADGRILASSGVFRDLDGVFKRPRSAHRRVRILLDLLHGRDHPGNGVGTLTRV